MGSGSSPTRFDLKYPDFTKNVSKGLILPAYLFTGKEEYLAESAVDAIIEKLLSEDERDLNLNIVYGKDAEGLREALATPPVFAKYRVVVVRQAQDLQVKFVEAVNAYLKQPPADGCLLMIAMDGERKAGVRKLDTNIETVECPKMKDAELARWSGDYLEKHSKRVESAAMERLISLNWPGLRELAGELDRLILLVGEKQAITFADVEELGTESSMMVRWKLSESVTALDLPGALNALENLLYWGLHPNQLIGDLFRALHQLWVIRYLQDSRKPELIREHLPLKDFVLNKLTQQATRIPLVRIETALLRLEEAELNIKRGLRSDDVEIGVLLVEVLTTLRGSTAGTVH